MKLQANFRKKLVIFYWIARVEIFAYAYPGLKFLLLYLETISLQ